LAYLSGQSEMGLGRQRYFLGFFVLAGVLTMMLALGALIALLAVPIGRLGLRRTNGGPSHSHPWNHALTGPQSIQDSAPGPVAGVAARPPECICVWSALWSHCDPLFGSVGCQHFRIIVDRRDAGSHLWAFLCLGLTWRAPVNPLVFAQRQLTSLFVRYSRAINIGGACSGGIALRSQQELGADEDILHLNVRLN
jgi:hypothetical protein